MDHGVNLIREGEGIRRHTARRPVVMDGDVSAKGLPADFVFPEQQCVVGACDGRNCSVVRSCVAGNCGNGDRRRGRCFGEVTNECECGSTRVCGGRRLEV